MSGNDQAALSNQQRGSGRFLFGFILGLLVGGLLARSYLGAGDRPAVPEWMGSAGESGSTVESSMDEVLQIAREALVHIYQNVDD